MLELLVAFTLYRLDAHWIWWAFYAFIIARNWDEKDCTK